MTPPQWAAEVVPGGTQGPGGIWFVVFVGLMTAVGGLGGITALFLVVKQRRKLSADTAQVLTSAAISLVKPIQDRLTAAEQDHTQIKARLGASEREVDRLRGEVADLRDQTKHLRAQLRRIVAAITSPTATLEALRELVRTDFTGS